MDIITEYLKNLDLGIRVGDKFYDIKIVPVTLTEPTIPEEPPVVPEEPTPTTTSDKPRWDDIEFLDTSEVYLWPMGINLQQVKIGETSIYFEYSPFPQAVKVFEGQDPYSCNPWVVAKIDGEWFASTFEWLRYGQKSKSKISVAGDHIKKPKFDDRWRPVVGETLGFFVSGLARTAIRNERVKSNIVWVNWK